MTKAKRIARICVQKVEELCGGDYARMLRDTMRSDERYAHPQFLAVTKHFYYDYLCARVYFEEVGEFWDMKLKCKQQ